MTSPQPQPVVIGEDVVACEKTQALQHKYIVWAMVKQQKQYQTEDMSETYQSSNKQVAQFATVGEFWEVYTHFRRPAVMPLGTFLHFVS